MKRADLILCIVVSFCLSTINSVEVYQTTTWQSKMMQKQPDISWNAQGSAQGGSIEVSIDDSKLLQEIDGWGASLTESSAYLLKKLKDNNADVYWRTLRRLFSHTTKTNDPMSVAFGMVRVPAGSCDFHLSDSTYDDAWNDNSLSKFSIDIDRPYILPVLKDILSVNADIKVMMSPWTAPAWMKTTGSVMNGWLKNDMYEVYANYFVKFISAYEAEGIRLYAVTLQNEPLLESGSYPSMRMDPGNQARLVKILGPKLRDSNLGHVKLLIFDHNWDASWFPNQVLSDAEAKKWINGSAFHCYGGNPEQQWDVKNAHPTKEIYQTECNGMVEWNYDFKSIITDDMKYYIRSTKAWSRTELMWNYVLNDERGPQNGGCTVCGGFLTIDEDRLPQVDYGAFYYGFGHFSKYMKKGTRLIASEQAHNGCVDTIAFDNIDSIHLVIVNSCGGDKTIRVNWGDKKLDYTVPSSLTTLYWKKPTTTTGIPVPVIPDTPFNVTPGTPVAQTPENDLVSAATQLTAGYLGSLLLFLFVFVPHLCR